MQPKICFCFPATTSRLSRGRSVIRTAVTLSAATKTERHHAEAGTKTPAWTVTIICFRIFQRKNAQAFAARSFFLCISLNFSLSLCSLINASYAVCARYAGSLCGKVCGRQNAEGLCSGFHIHKVIVQTKHTVLSLYADRFCKVLCGYGYGIAVY